MTERPEQIQSVVTVAAFRPLDDSVLIQRSPDGNWKLPSLLMDGRLPSINAVVDRIINECVSDARLSLSFLSDSIISGQSGVTSNDNFVAAFVGDAKIRDASFKFTNEREYLRRSCDDMTKIILDEIFAVYQSRGTLLPLLHQPVLIQPMLLDCPGNCVHVVARPLDEQNYLMPHECVRDVVRRLLRPLFPRVPKVVLAKRLAVVPTTLWAPGQRVPAWVLQYGIELAPHLALSMDLTLVTSYPAQVVPQVTDPLTQGGLELAQRELIMPSSLAKMHLPTRSASFVIK